MTAKVKEIKKLDSMDIRNLCIRKNWYTMGTNEAYSKMLLMADTSEVTPRLIFELAHDIYFRSDYDCFRDYNQTDTENIQSIMYEIGRLVETFYEVEEIERVGRDALN